MAKTIGLIEIEEENKKSEKEQIAIDKKNKTIKGE